MTPNNDVGAVRTKAGEIANQRRNGKVNIGKRSASVTRSVMMLRCIWVEPNCATITTHRDQFSERHEVIQCLVHRSERYGRHIGDDCFINRLCGRM